MDFPYRIGVAELVIVVLAGINCLVPLATLVIVFLIYRRLDRLEQKLDGNR